MTVKRWAVGLVAVIALAAPLGTALWLRWQLDHTRAELAAARGQLEQAIRRAEKAEQERSAVPSESPEHQTAPAPDRDTTSRAGDETTRRELVKLLGEKDDKLTAAYSVNEELRRRVDQLTERVTALETESTRIASSQKDTAERLDTAQRLNEALQTELKGKSTLSGQLEGANKQLQQREQEARQKLARLTKLAEQAEDLNRRRDMLLTSVLRRYREVTDLYRTFSVSAAPERERTALTGSDLSRVQNAINQAEDDMRQLQGLNSQAERLQKEMAAARR